MCSRAVHREHGQLHGMCGPCIHVLYFKVAAWCESQQGLLNALRWGQGQRRTGSLVLPSFTLCCFLPALPLLVLWALMPEPAPAIGTHIQVLRKLDMVNMAVLSGQVRARMGSIWCCRQGDCGSRCLTA